MRHHLHPEDGDFGQCAAPNHKPTISVGNEGFTKTWKLQPSCFTAYLARAGWELKSFGKLVEGHPPCQVSPLPWAPCAKHLPHNFAVLSIQESCKFLSEKVFLPSCPGVSD